MTELAAAPAPRRHRPAVLVPDRAAGPAPPAGAAPACSRALEVGDEVMLTSGIFGIRPRRWTTRRISVEIAPGVIVEVVRGAVGSRSPRPRSPATTTTSPRRSRPPRRRRTGGEADDGTQDRAGPGAPSRCSSSGWRSLYGLVALGGTWKPALGLDLEGGTRISADRQGQRRHAESASTRPPSIIDQRVNGSGVAEAEVTTQGNQYIVVEIPGQSRATSSTR